MKDRLIKWIKRWFDKNGPDSSAVIGISGGKDSTICAALCCEALGKDRVFGVLMPNGNQSDIQDAYDIVTYLGIKSAEINIGGTVDDIAYNLREHDIYMNEIATINLQPRIRMSILYAVSQSMNGRVINTTNICEGVVGNFTKYGDVCGDIAPFQLLTVSQIVQIGKELNLPDYFIEKIPADGLTGKTDEENLGVTYQEIESYLEGTLDSELDSYIKIQKLRENSAHKRNSISAFNPDFD